MYEELFCSKWERLESPYVCFTRGSLFQTGMFSEQYKQVVTDSLAEGTSFFIGKYRHCFSAEDLDDQITPQRFVEMAESLIGDHWYWHETSEGSLFIVVSDEPSFQTRVPELKLWPVGFVDSQEFWSMSAFVIANQQIVNEVDKALLFEDFESLGDNLLQYLCTSGFLNWEPKDPAPLLNLLCGGL